MDNHYIYILGDILITINPLRQDSGGEQKERSEDTEDTLTPGESDETWPSPEEIDERIDRYFNRQGDDDEWMDYT